MADDKALFTFVGTPSSIQPLSKSLFFPSLKFLFEKNGFKIMKIEENKINGGSYRIYCKKILKNLLNIKKKQV